MSKALTIFGMVVAGLLVAIFAADWVTGIPFESANPLMNLGVILAGALLGYLSWDAFRQIR